MQIYVGRGACDYIEVARIQKEQLCIFYAQKQRQPPGLLETGMVYPPEGLFYIEMDQAPPGKL